MIVKSSKHSVRSGSPWQRLWAPWKHAHPSRHALRKNGQFQSKNAAAGLVPSKVARNHYCLFYFCFFTLKSDMMFIDDNDSNSVRNHISKYQEVLSLWWFRHSFCTEKLLHEPRSSNGKSPVERENLIGYGTIILIVKRFPEKFDYMWCYFWACSTWCKRAAAVYKWCKNKCGK